MINGGVMAGARIGLRGAWLKALLFVLLGYALFGKGFSYLFLGEAILVLGFVIFLHSRKIMLLFNDPVLCLWAAFAFWGVCRTIPFIPQYRTDAVRDAAIWGYGVFALLIVAFVTRSSQISRALNTYRKFVRWYLLCIPVLFIVSVSFGHALPTIPWSPGVEIIHLKSEDTAVHIVAAGLFMMIFPDRTLGTQKHQISIFRTVAYGGFWVTSL